MKRVSRGMESDDPFVTGLGTRPIAVGARLWPKLPSVPGRWRATGAGLAHALYGPPAQQSPGKESAPRCVQGRVPTPYFAGRKVFCTNGGASACGAWHCTQLYRALESVFCFLPSKPACGCP